MGELANPNPTGAPDAGARADAPFDGTGLQTGGDEAPADELLDSLPEPQRFGQYTLFRRLGRGGGATVFLAGYVTANGSVEIRALKRLHEHLNEEKSCRRAFAKEAVLMARLRHPNIVEVLDHGEADGRAYLAMPYLEGCDLSRVVGRLRAAGESMSPSTAAFIVSEVLDALHYAHEAIDDKGASMNIVHRDVSPQNVFLTTCGEVKLLDFGIAKATRASISTSAGAVKGKFAYMAPEQARGQKVDRRVDVWSAGVLLWELLVGECLFASSSEFATITSSLSAEISNPSDHVSGIDPRLDAIVQRALSREPEGRFPTAAEMRTALLRYLAEHPCGTYQLRAIFESHFVEQLQEIRASVDSALVASAHPLHPIGSTVRAIGGARWRRSAIAASFAGATAFLVWRGVPMRLPTRVDESDVRASAVASAIERSPQSQAPRPFFRGGGTGRPEVAMFLPRRDSFWESFQRVAEAAAEGLDMRIELYDAGDDAATMVRELRAVVEGDDPPDAVVVQSFMGNGPELLRIADAAGVPVVLVNTAVDERSVGRPRAVLQHWIGSIRPDDEGAGYELGRLLVEGARARGLRAPDGTIHVIAINGLDGDGASTERLDGLRRFVASRDDVVLDGIANGDWSRSRARQAAIGLIASHPNSAVVWAASDDMALGAIEGIVRAGREPGTDTLVGGVDWSPEGLTAVRDGQLYATMGGHFVEGASALLLVHDYAAGFDFAPEVEMHTPMREVTRDNVENVMSVMAAGGWQRVDFNALSRVGDRDRPVAHLDPVTVFGQR